MQGMMYVLWNKLLHKLVITKVFLEVQNIKMLYLHGNVRNLI